MIRLFFLIFPVSLLAGNISVSLTNMQESTTYTVENPAQALKAQLDFPTNFYTVALHYQTTFNQIHISSFAAFLLTDSKTTGNDRDWYQGTLSVYSSSTDRVHSYYQAGIELSKELYHHWTPFVKLQYTLFDQYWTDTYQEDYVKGITETVEGKSIRYKQTRYEGSIGIQYDTPLSSALSLQIRPYMGYLINEATDEHLLRDFYTTQKAYMFGYGGEIGVKLTVSNNLYLTAHIDHKRFQDNDLDMDYFNLSDTQYMSLPSSYENKLTAATLGIWYNY